MTVCKCGARWETRDSTYEEWKYGMCEKCIAKARENGEIPPKRVSEGTSITSVLYDILCGEINE